MSADTGIIRRERGDTFPFTVTLRDGDGNLLDLTGASFLLTVNAQEDPTAAEAPEFTLAGAVAAPATGVIEFSMSESDADIVGTYYYDLQMTDSSGYVRTVLRGPFVMDQDITK